MTTATTSGGGPHALEPTDGPLTTEELQLAARNHALPLEALTSDLTPAGLHYLLNHFDIPAVDAATWRLHIRGAVRTPLELTLDALHARPRQTIPVTLECAGNGRALLRPRPISQPWLLGAVGTAEWTGAPLAPLLDEAGVRPDAVELVFTGADRGVQGGEEHDYARSLTVADATRPEVLLGYEMNGHPLPPQHGHPVRLLQSAAHRATWTDSAARQGVVGAWSDRAGRGGGRRPVAGRPPRPADRPVRLARMVPGVGRPPGCPRAGLPRHGRHRRRPTARAGVEPPGHGQHRRPADDRDGAIAGIRKEPLSTRPLPALILQRAGGRCGTSGRLHRWGVP